MLSGRLQRLGQRAALDRRGVAAIEFAFIAPLLILLFFGLAQLCQGIIGSRHVDHAASAVGDLVAQCANINDTDLANYFNAGSDIVAPLPVNASIIGERVTSVVVTDGSGTTKTQWSQASDSSNLTTAYAPNTVIQLPANLVVKTQGDSVIKSEVVYKYTFPFTAGGLIPIGRNMVSLSFGHAITFDDVTYFKPRKSTAVTYTGTGPGGSNSGGSSEGAGCSSS